jgi:hypothetical protein
MLIEYVTLRISDSCSPWVQLYGRRASSDSSSLHRDRANPERVIARC